MYPMDDDEEMKDKVLEMLGGEVDDYAGSKLEDDEEKPADQGVTIEIAVKPHGAADEEAKEKFIQEEEAEGHDDVRHALGMCKGGCVK